MLFVIFTYTKPNFHIHTEYLFAYDESRIRKMRTGKRIMRISLSALKIKRSMAVLFKTKDKLNQDSLLTIYNAIIQPYAYLFDCCEVWGRIRSFDKCITPITIIQKKAVRLLCKCHYKAHPSPLFKKLKILKFSDLVNYKIGM